jgi:hypothetical protein
MACTMANSSNLLFDGYRGWIGSVYKRAGAGNHLKDGSSGVVVVWWWCVVCGVWFVAYLLNKYGIFVKHLLGG